MGVSAAATYHYDGWQGLGASGEAAEARGRLQSQWLTKHLKVPGIV